MIDNTPPNPWNRRLWGVLFDGDGDKAPHLVGTTSNDRLRAWANYPDEEARPLLLTRPLLFQTRAEARAWCRRQMDEWRARKDFVARWTVRPVRVRETISIEHVRPAGRRR